MEKRSKPFLAMRITNFINIVSIHGRKRIQSVPSVVKGYQLIKVVEHLGIFSDNELNSDEFID